MIAVKYSGNTLVAQRAIAITTTAATRIISGDAPSGGGWNHKKMLKAAASRAIAGPMKEGRFSIGVRFNLNPTVSMHRSAGSLSKFAGQMLSRPRYWSDSAVSRGGGKQALMYRAGAFAEAPGDEPGRQ